MKTSHPQTQSVTLLIKTVKGLGRWSRPLLKVSVYETKVGRDYLEAIGNPLGAEWTFEALIARIHMTDKRIADVVGSTNYGCDVIANDHEQTSVSLRDFLVSVRTAGYYWHISSEGETASMLSKLA